MSERPCNPTNEHIDNNKILKEIEITMLPYERCNSFKDMFYCLKAATIVFHIRYQNPFLVLRTMIIYYPFIKYPNHKQLKLLLNKPQTLTHSKPSGSLEMLFSRAYQSKECRCRRKIKSQNLMQSRNLNQTPRCKVIKNPNPNAADINIKITRY